MKSFDLWNLPWVSNEASLEVNFLLPRLRKESYLRQAEKIRDFIIDTSGEQPKWI